MLNNSVTQFNSLIKVRNLMFVKNFNLLTRFYFLPNQCSFYLQWVLLLIIIYNP